jgi:hypothetical protein
MPLAFSDEQMDRLTAAATLLPPQHRHSFMRLVGNHINTKPQSPSMDDVEAGITFALSTFGVAVGSGPRHPNTRIKRHGPRPR